MFTLPQLPYAYDALEPYIDALTMEIHYTKHHQGYVDNLNAALKDFSELQKKSITDLMLELEVLPESIRVAVRNQGGGHYNHTFFWSLLTPAVKTERAISHYATCARLINQRFGSFQKFQQEFTQVAKSRFGSGWAWLVVSPHGDLEIISTPNQDCPLMFECVPLLGLDVWEHAYYLKYQNKRVDYIQAWWHLINWAAVEDIVKQIV